MKKLLDNLKYTVLLVFLLGATGCEDYLDINEDPDNANDAAPYQLLPGTQVWMGFTMANNLNRLTETLVQRITNSRYEFYSLNGGEVDNDWDRTYRTLLNIEDIIEKAEANGDLNYAGVAKLEKAYIYSVLVDLFNDVPFSEASQGAGNFSAKFDDAAEIYDQLFLLIDEAIANLEEEDQVALGGAGDDLIYNGDEEDWISMGNSLKLKMYNQIRLVDPQRAAQGISALLAEPTALINSNAENFELPFFESTSPNNLNPYYQTFYVTKDENFISTKFDSLLSANEDPRYPYLIYHQDGDFYGRAPGDGITIRGNDANIRSIYGVYPAGGIYDDGSAESVAADEGPGDAPMRMITYPMVKFVEAEAQLTLEGVSGDPAVAFEQALRASFAEMMAYSTTRQSPALAQDAIDLYVSSRVNAFKEAETVREKLEILITEKYVALIGNGIESYNDYRRTGFPVLAKAITPEGPFPLRLPYSATELEANPNAPDQPLDTTPIFWDINN